MTPDRSSALILEARGLERAIEHQPTGRTAFVGRTLRGPVNQCVSIKGFSDFQQIFGGLWQPSSLGYAVEQFFDNGGRDAIIVRVINGARAATLTLRAGTERLHLQALRPGTREFLRASVDFDNITADSPALFNLTVQRVRAHGTGQVEDQEIYQRVSLSPAAESYLPLALVSSSLFKMIGEVPSQRPNATLDPTSGLATAYINSNCDGDDGAPLTDYDLIGSRSDRSGLFALAAADFNFLCMPPLSREQDVGASALLVASRYCKERRALLIVDPRLAWHTADDALAGLRSDGIADENCVMYFPRILALDKLRGHFESFAPCGAIAGMLARHDESHPVWGAAALEEPILRPGYRPACLVGEDRRLRLANLGVNTLQSVRSTTRALLPSRTLGFGNAANSDWRFLASRRLALFILNSIESGTQWVQDAVCMSDPQRSAVAAQVVAFFTTLHAGGAFGVRSEQDAFFVICDERVNPESGVAGQFQLLVGFAAMREGEFHSFRIAHTANGSELKSVSVNRFNFSPFSPAELEWVDSIASQLQS